MLQSSLNLYRNAYAGLAGPTWWLSLVMLVNRSGTMVLPFMTIYLKDKMGFSITDAGFIIAFFGAGAIAGSFIGGRLVDKIGFYKIQFWSLVLNGVMFMLLGYMQTFWQIGLCMFGAATLGEAFRPANAAAIAYYSNDSNRTRSYSLNRLAINLGWSIGPAIGGILAYKWLFWVDGITCIIAALLLLAVLPPVKHEAHSNEKDNTGLPVVSVWKDKTYLKFMFFVFIMAFCFLQMFSMLPVFYKEQLHFSKSMIGLLLALNGFVIVLFEMVMIYKLEGRRSPVSYISLGALLIGLSYALLNLPLQGLVIALISMVFITLGEMFMFPFVNTFWVSRSSQYNRGQYASVYTMFFSLAHVLAPTFGSQMVSRFGYYALWYSVFILSGIAAFGFYKFKKINE
jgi:predicted MFS family arabinose efflux permease